MIGMEVPGPGAVWSKQAIEWVRPVLVGDQIELTVTVENVSAAAGVLSLSMNAINENGDLVMHGTAQVKATEKLALAVAPSPSDGRVALVTGGSRGIGAAIARKLGERGHKVAINYQRSDDKALEVVSDIRSRGGVAEAFRGNIGEQAEASLMIDSVVERFGAIEIVVHAATPGIIDKKVSELTLADLGPYLDIYLGGALTLVSKAASAMAERKFGRLIFIGSSAMFGTPPVGMSAYLAVKESLYGLVKSFATELGPSGVTANMISPGTTVTDLTAHYSARGREIEALKNPMRRLAMVEDTAEFAAYLAADEAGYINGANLPITGGPN
jgi:3-oxoacyl-[acyl-carrier protein] reductase